MRHKNDMVMAATSARSYNRRWRAKKLSWTAIGKIKYLFDGAIDYMDEITLAYTSVHFNKLRTALGFKQDSELTELVEQSEAFRIVRDKDSHEIVAFMSPLVGDRYVPTPNQVIEEPVIPYDVFECKINAMANDNDRDKISENQRQHKYGINMHVLLAGNVPKFHITPSEDALIRISNGLYAVLNDNELRNRYYGEFIRLYMKRYNASIALVEYVLETYIDDKLTGHMARRVGIENWPSKDILKWLDYYFGANRLEKVVREAHEVWIRHMEQKQGKPVPNVF